MSAKDCGHHGHKWRKIFRRIFTGLLIFTFIVLVIILIVWAILQPSKPQFILQDATVYAFNLSTPYFLTSNFQVTLYSRNPNDKIGIFYDRLDVYAVYHNQPITVRTRIPWTYQDTKDVTVWSPFVYGTLVPIAPYNSIALNQDKTAGAVPLMIKIEGRVRWRVGAVTTGQYHLYVNCPALITFGNPAAGTVVGNNAVKYQLVQRCSVSV